MDNIKPIPPFKRFCGSLGAFPEAFSDAMTVYEALEWLYRYIGGEVVPKTNEAIELANQLKEYVEHYFDNLDVQEEINNKLDEMAESGELEEIIAQFLQSASTLAFNNVSDMKESTKLIDGSFAETYGFYTKGDGGGAKYIVREITNDDVIDNATIFALADDNLIAVLVYKDELDYLKIGGKVNDNTYDATELINKAIDILDANKGGILHFPIGNIYCSGTIELKNSVELKGVADFSAWNGNSEFNFDNCTVVHHTPTVTNTKFLTLDQTDIHLGYVYNHVIDGFYIIGSENSSIGLELINDSKSQYSNITIIGFEVNILCEYNMEVNFSNVFSQQATEDCLLIDNRIVEGSPHYSTTLYFDHCYFGQTKYSGGRPLNIKVDAVEGASFCNCILETSDLSNVIEDGNSVNFVNLYVENIPQDTTNPTFKIGEHSGTSEGVINITNGFIMGNVVSAVKTDTYLFDVDNVKLLNVSGCTLHNSDYVIKVTSNTGLINFTNNVEYSIAHSAWYTASELNNQEKFTIINCKNTDNSVIESKFFIPKQTLNFKGISNNDYLNGWANYGYGTQYNIFGNMVNFEFSATAGTISDNTAILPIPSSIKPTVAVYCNVRDISDLSDNHQIIIYPNSDYIVLPSSSNFTAGHVYQGTVSYYIY